MLEVFLISARSSWAASSMKVHVERMDLVRVSVFALAKKDTTEKSVKTRSATQSTRQIYPKASSLSGLSSGFY